MSRIRAGPAMPSPSLHRADADADAGAGACPADGGNVGASAAESVMRPLSAGLAAPAGQPYFAATSAAGPASKPLGSRAEVPRGSFRTDVSGAEVSARKFPAWKPLHSRAEFARPRSAGESWPEGLPEESGDSDGGVPAASAVAGAHFKGRRGPSGSTGSAPRYARVCECGTFVATRYGRVCECGTLLQRGMHAVARHVLLGLPAVQHDAAQCTTTLAGRLV
jgi:hypothetical protein